MVTKLATVVLVLIGTMASTSPEAQVAPRTKANIRADSAQATCDCSILPWKPDPPCPKQCTGLMLRVPADELSTKLRLSTAVTKRIVATKQGGVTQEKVDVFVKSPEGREFISAVERSPKTDVQELVSRAKSRGASKK